MPQSKWGTPARQRNATHVKLKRICDIQMKLEIRNHKISNFKFHLTKINMSPLDMDLKCVNFGGACVNFGGAV